VRFLKSFGQFWYDFIIGDDWKIAAAVVTALVVVFALLKADVFGDAALTLIGAATVVIAFAVSLAIDVRPKSGRGR
jgi:hypothetical protein